MQGSPLGLSFTGYEVRPARLDDLAACNALCRDVHGFGRGIELRDGIGQNTATVVEHLGEVSGYATLLRPYGCENQLGSDGTHSRRAGGIDNGGLLAFDSHDSFSLGGRNIAARGF
jgi:hypothetical protein